MMTILKTKPASKQPLWKPSALLVALALPTVQAWAQVPPDAGQILQQSQPFVQAPLAPSVVLDLEGEPLTEAESGGQTVNLKGVTFTGNSRFSEAELLQVLGDAWTQPQDLAGLRHISNQISRYYREQGYPFARAFLPAQSLAEGVLKVEVVEGRYGSVEITGDQAELAEAVAPYIASLSPGSLIASPSLERQMLLLGDLPGIDAMPVMRPGEQVGEGDLEVRVQATERISTWVGADNHGSRFSGAYRGRVGANAYRLLTPGDQLSITALYSSEDTWLGSLEYSLPLGGRGLRAEASYAITDYTLGKGFEGYTGTAEVYRVGVRYPLVRRQQSNLSLSLHYQYKDLSDSIDFAGYRKATESHAVPVAVQFDRRDGLGLGGVTFGTLVLTNGVLDQSLKAGPDEDYSFSSLRLNVARLQSLGHGLDLYGRLDTQWANRDDLDGSESFSLGGPSGVRAFPNGEGSDSRGWLAQLELRYRAGAGWTPYLYYDQGYTPDGGIDQGDDRSISGAGVGVQYRRADFSINLSSAWALSGGDALSDDRQRSPRIWATAMYRF